MKCPHCLGFMVIDAGLNMEGARNKVRIGEWQCLNCGEILAPRTSEPRRLQRQGRHVWQGREAGRCLVS